MPTTIFHLVLDLDSTLINSIDEDDEDYDLIKEFKLYSNSRNHELRKSIYFLNIRNINSTDDGKVTKMWGVFRPYLFEFLLFCSEYFEKIHIWSAGHKKYVHELIKKIFKDKGFEVPKNILTQKDCIITDINVYKPLKKIFELQTSFGANEKNTFAIDDRKDTFSKNIKNGILIPAYEPDVKNIDDILDDDCLLKIIKWLKTEEVYTCDDVRKLKKGNIFNQELDFEDYLEVYDNNVL